MAKIPQVEGFTNLRFIDQGGMAEVYEARQAGLKRRVALKILFPAYAQQHDLALRFQREGQTIAGLNHANIIQIYGTGTTAEGRPYIAMEYCPQNTLGHWLKLLSDHQQLLQTGHALAIAQQMAGALCEAHENGIYHRDLKPSNILIRKDGSAVLADLGIAAVSSRTRITSTGTILGTPEYMSPEQASGLPVDGRSDIYSLGIILYEMMAGVRPFNAEQSLAVLHKQIYEQPEPLARLRPDLPDPICRLVHKCLEKKPEARYQQTRQLAAALEACVHSVGGGRRVFHSGTWPALGSSAYLDRRKVAHLPRKQHKGRRQGQRGRLVVAAMLVLLGGLLIYNFMNSGPPSEPTRASSAQAGTRGAGLYTSAAISPTKLGETSTLQAIAVDTPIVEASSATATVPSPEPSVTAPQPRPEAGQWIAPRQILFVSDRAGSDALYSMPADQPELAQQLTSPGGYDWWPSWCGTDQIVFERGDDQWETTVMQIMAMSSDGDDLHALTSAGLPPGSAMNGNPTCSPDGRYLVLSSRAQGAAGNDFKIGLIDLIKSTPSFSLLGDGYSLGGHVTWSPNSDAVAFMHYIADESRFAVYQVNLNAPYQSSNLTSNLEKSCKYPTWSPDGRLVAFACSRRSRGEFHWDLVLWNTISAQTEVLLRDLHIGPERFDERRVVRHALTPTWSPDGKHLVFSSDQDGDWDLYALNVDAKALTNLTADWPSDEFHPSWGQK